jgi:hypothetical protein
MLDRNNSNTGNSVHQRLYAECILRFELNSEDCSKWRTHDDTEHQNTNQPVIHHGCIAMEMMKPKVTATHGTRYRDIGARFRKAAVVMLAASNSALSPSEQ